MENSTKVLLGFAGIVAATLIIYGVYAFAQSLPQIGAITTSTPISAPSFVETLIKVFLGSQALPLTWESLVLHLAIFVIVLFAVADVVEMFSTFSATTSWVIAFGLAIIAGVTGITDYIAGLFAVTAGIGAVGIMLIVIAAFLAAISLNWGIGGWVKNWRQTRQLEIETYQQKRGGRRIAAGAETMAEIGKVAEEAGTKEKGKGRIILP